MGVVLVYQTVREGDRLNIIIRSTRHMPLYEYNPSIGSLFKCHTKSSSYKTFVKQFREVHFQISLIKIDGK